MNKYLKGLLALASANLIAKIIGAVYRIPLTNILGAEGIGVYQMVFPVYSLLLIFASGGFPLALSKIIAEQRALGRADKISAYFKKTLFITISMGLVFGLLLFSLSSFLATIQGSSNVTLSYFSLGVAVVFACSICAFRGFFQGYQDMRPSSISVVLEQIVKLVVGLILAKLFISKGLNWGVFGATVGVAVGEVFAFVYLLFSFFIKKKKYNYKSYKIQSDSALVKLALPITLGALISPLSSAFESLFVVRFLSTYMSQGRATSLFGLQTGMINPLINFPIILISSICVSLLPELSYLFKQNETSKAKQTINKTIKYIFVIMLACSVGYGVLAYDILKTLYPNVINQTIASISRILFILSSISMLFSSLAQTFTTIMQADNKPYLPVRNFTISVSVRVILTIALIFVPSLNILGLAIANLMSFVIYAFLNYASVKKTLPIEIKRHDLFYSLFSAFIMALVVLGFKTLLSGYDGLLLILLSIVVGAVVYMGLVIMFKVVSLSEIKTLFSRRKDKFVADKNEK